MQKIAALRGARVPSKAPPIIKANIFRLTKKLPGRVLMIEINSQPGHRITTQFSNISATNAWSLTAAP
jgi:hypothetical protein